MNDTARSLGAASTQIIERSLDSVWRRLAPLSVGAVASSAAIVAGGALVRGVLGRLGLGRFRWVAAAAVLPIALWLLAERSAAEPLGEQEPGEGKGKVDGPSIEKEQVGEV